MGRGTKYNQEVAQRILQAVRVGTTLEHAAQAGGIVYETFRRWRKDNSAFNAAIEKAEGDAVLGRMARIEKAGREGKWQADAWWLERRFPQEYGRTIQEHQGKDGGDIHIKVIYDSTNNDNNGSGGENA